MKAMSKGMAALAFAFSVALGSVGCASESEDDSDSANGAFSEDGSEGDEALERLKKAVDDPSSLVTLETYGSEDAPTRVMAIISDKSTAKGLDHDTSRFVYFKNQTFAYFDPKTKGIAVIGNSSTQESDVAAMLEDLRGDAVAEPAGGIETQGIHPLGIGHAVASAAERAVEEEFLSVLVSLVHSTAGKGMKQPLAKTEDLASATAKAVAEAADRVPKWVARRARTNVKGTIQLENVDWQAVGTKLRSLGTKDVYLGDEGARAYLAAVAKEKPILIMTHSGKLSDARLADATIGPALRKYVERGDRFMPEVLELIAKREGSQLVIGGGMLEGGQVIAYRAAAQKGIVADSVMSGKGVDYIANGKIAPSRSVVIKGADWGAESELAASAAKVGLVWGGGDQALAEATRLLTSGKPVYVIREAAALASVEKMPNAAASLTAESLPNGIDRSLLHVFETWEDALAALKAP